jgi:hypothetical protein
VFMLFLMYRVVIRIFAVMSAAAATTVAPESVSVSEEQYWPLSLDAVRDCDLSYMNDKWSEDMIKDGMRSILRVGQLPEIRDKEISVWTYLSKYSPPADRGFQFSYGDDRIVTLVGDHMEIGHSGTSIGWTMRNIEFIAKNGLPAHREMFLKSRRNN